MDIKQYNGVLGYDKNKKAKRRKEVLTKLAERVCYRWDFYTRSQLVIENILEGYRPDKLEQVTYLDRSKNRRTFPITIYRLKHEENGYREISSIEYDFAVHLVKQNITCMKQLEDAVDEEYRIVEEEIASTVLATGLEDTEGYAERLEFETWLENEAFKYRDMDKLAIIKTVMLNEINRYSFLEARIFMVLVENIDSPKCKEALKRKLYIRNTLNRRLFTYITGLPLPDTEKATNIFIKGLSKEDYNSPIPVELDKKYSGMEEVYITQKTGWYDISMGTRNKLDGYTYSLVKQEDEYLLIGSFTGTKLTVATTEKDCLDWLKTAIKNKGVMWLTESENAVLSKYLDLEKKTESRLGYRLGDY